MSSSDKDPSRLPKMKRHGKPLQAHLDAWLH